MTDDHSPQPLVEETCRRLGATLLAAEPRVRIFLFGSRASGHGHPRSDIDLGVDLGRPVPPELMARLRDAFDALPILQRVDLVDFAAADPEFKQVALEHSLTLYERQAA